MSKETLDYQFMFDLADIQGTVNSLRDLILDMISHESEYEHEMIESLDNLKVALGDLNLMVPVQTVDTEKKRATLEKLIIAHQVILAYRRVSEFDDRILGVLRYLTKLYPLFLLLVAFDQIEDLKLKERGE